MPSYSGLYDGVYGQPYALLSNTAKKGNTQTQLARLLSRRTYGRAAYRELIKELIGAAAGEEAVASHSRVRAERNLLGNDLGGARAIETFTGIERNTTAADETNIEDALSQQTQPTYAVDASGNGGGGKLGV